MSIADVMTRDLPTVGPRESLREAARRMTESGAKALPVCDDDRLVGIITDWDITRAVASEKIASEESVGDHMSTDLVTAAPDATFGDVAQLMADRRLHHLLVRDGDRFAGMVHLDVEWSDLGGAQAPMATFAAPI
jgi:CBS domain-containing protein